MIVGLIGPEYLLPNAKMMEDRIAKVAADTASAVARLEKQITDTVPPTIDLDALKAAVIADLPVPKDGKSVDLVDIKAMVDGAVAEAISALPPAKDGAPGKDIDPETVAATIKAMVDGAVAALPEPEPGKDGKSVTTDDVAPLIAAEVAKAVAAIPVPTNGKDGAEIADALIDRSGNLVITLSDGRMKELGRVVGENGADVDTESVLTVIKETVAAEVAKIPAPRDGVDGVSWSDIAFEQAGERSIRCYAEKDGRRVERLIAFDVPIYRGFYEAGREYAKGDMVTFAGCLWHCNESATTDKPAETPGCKTWTLAARKGRDGKDGRNGIDKTAPVKLDPEKK